MIRVDAALFAAAQAGDPFALERMLRELQPDIRRYARRQCHRTTAIEDVVQEALIVLYRRLGTVRDPLAIAGWIFRVVTRLCMLPVLGLIRGAEELTERHEAEYFVCPALPCNRAATFAPRRIVVGGFAGVGGYARLPGLLDDRAGRNHSTALWGDSKLRCAG